MKSFLAAFCYSLALTIVIMFFGSLWGGSIYPNEWGWFVRMICAFIWLMGIVIIFLDYQSK